MIKMIKSIRNQQAIMIGLVYIAYGALYVYGIKEISTKEAGFNLFLAGVFIIVNR